MIALWVGILVGLVLIASGVFTGFRTLKATDPSFTLPMYGDMLQSVFEVLLGITFIIRIAAFAWTAAAMGVGCIIIRLVQRTAPR